MARKSGVRARVAEILARHPEWSPEVRARFLELVGARVERARLARQARALGFELDEAETTPRKGGG